MINKKMAFVSLTLILSLFVSAVPAFAHGHCGSGRRNTTTYCSSDGCLSYNKQNQCGICGYDNETCISNGYCSSNGYNCGYGYGRRC